MKKLKDCPCCGSKVLLRSDFGQQCEKAGLCQTAFVRCTNPKCLLEGYVSDSCFGETEQTAIDAWNKRVKE